MNAGFNGHFRCCVRAPSVSCISDLSQNAQLKDFFFSFYFQVTERKSQLAQLESMDNGKPIDEAEWDMVSHSTISLGCAVREGYTALAHVFPLHQSFHILGSFQCQEMHKKERFSLSLKLSGYSEYF